MEPSEFFRDEWPAMARRIGATLARRGVAADDRDDILQETAYRLYRAWRMVDQERGVEAYARTIATNVWRGQSRRTTPDEVLGDLPEHAAAVDSVERTCLARDELRLVRRAIDRLRPEQQVLLRDVAAYELGAVELPAVTPDAVRTARKRARIQLRAIVEAASAVAAIIGWLRRAGVRRPATVAVVPAAFVAGALLLAPREAPPERVIAPADQEDVATSRGVPTRREVTSARRPPRSPARPVVVTKPSAGGTARRATEPNYVRFGAGDVDVGLHFEADIAGRRVEIGQQPSGLPACAEVGAPLPLGVASCESRR